MYHCNGAATKTKNKMTTEQKIMAEFTAFFQEAKKEADEKVSNSINLDAISKLKQATAKLKQAKAIQFTIEDVTPEGYGN